MDSKCKKENSRKIMVKTSEEIMFAPKCLLFNFWKEIALKFKITTYASGITDYINRLVWGIGINSSKIKFWCLVWLTCLR